MMSGLDATGNEGIEPDTNGKDQWNDGHVLTFWAYGYDYPGTTQYHVYHTQKDYFKQENAIQRFMLSSYKQEVGEEAKNGWTLAFSFWAFEDKLVAHFKGRNCDI